MIVLVATLLAACGGGSATSGNGLASRSPQQIVAAARAAARGAATVHITGSIRSGNEPIRLDMEFVARKGAQGHLSVAGLEVDLVGLERAFYLRGSRAFYRRFAGPAAATLLHGRWIKAPAKAGDFAPLARLTDLADMTDASLAAHGELTHAGTATIRGQKAVAVTDAAAGGTLYVAATGTPYPLEITDRTGRSAGIVFDRWNQPVTLTPPAGAINIDQLQSGR